MAQTVKDNKLVQKILLGTAIGGALAYLAYTGITKLTGIGAPKTIKGQIEQYLKRRVDLEKEEAAQRAELKLEKTADGTAYTKETYVALETLYYLANRDRFYKGVTYFRQIRRAKMQNLQVYAQDCFQFMPNLFALMRHNKEKYLDGLGIDRELYKKTVENMTDEELFEVGMKCFTLLSDNAPGKIIGEELVKPGLAFVVEKSAKMIDTLERLQPAELMLQPFLLEDYFYLMFKTEMDDLTATIHHIVYNAPDETLLPKILEYLKLNHEIEAIIESVNNNAEGGPMEGDMLPPGVQM
eukprot:TRINITY_DN17447_c0_g1_i1.p1 TRINITY_DN17447_c0_g1~~TRINITY_DN17447_c0_g1_i1.p1  ORF type:complete len:297 (-),score=88.47 TRINITY_DN17447_c0_g1_i1:101-991(-)